MTFPELGVCGTGLGGAGVNPGEGVGWYLFAPVNGSERPL